MHRLQWLPCTITIKEKKNMSMQTRLLLACVPVLIFASLLFFLWRGLSLKPEILPSALLGKPAPSFQLTDLLSPAYPLTEQQFKGRVTVLTVWATWCYACEAEHPLLMKIKKQYPNLIYGLAYKDDPQMIQIFLKEQGNPYSRIGNDSRGDVAMDFGVYGTPETFILDKKGVIVYRHVGALSEQLWEEELLPLIQKLS
jgi:cytochrome c biogenesis protein CcmG/thiol:disulfide interchange protein DsbE